jgi:hypothetical protein
MRIFGLAFTLVFILSLPALSSELPHPACLESAIMHGSVSSEECEELAKKHPVEVDEFFELPKYNLAPEPNSEEEFNRSFGYASSPIWLNDEEFLIRTIEYYGFNNADAGFSHVQLLNDGVTVLFREVLKHLVDLKKIKIGGKFVLFEIVPGEELANSAFSIGHAESAEKVFGPFETCRICFAGLRSYEYDPDLRKLRVIGPSMPKNRSNWFLNASGGSYCMGEFIFNNGGTVSGLKKNGFLSELISAGKIISDVSAECQPMVSRFLQLVSPR